VSASRFGALDSRYRERIAEILSATGMFSDEEVAVGLELFDEVFKGGGWRKEEGAPASGSPSSTLPPPSSSFEFLGAFDSTDTLIAYACYGPTPGADRTFDLYWIAVHPSAQGAGHGGQLLAEVERRLRARSGRLLVAETSSRAEYEPTRRFYGARGYHVAARVADFYAPADDRVIYAKRLTPKATSADRPPSPNRSARSASP
jgi:ribosomal protein S18 acetylase RimI-like enzyme